MKTLNLLRLPLLLIGATAFIAACSSDAEQTNASKTPAEAVKVNTYTIAAAGDAFMLPIGGQVVAAYRTYINAKTNGYVSSIAVELGEEVEEGQLLASISNEELSARKARTEAMVNEAESGFELAEIEFNRMKRLIEAGSATQREFDMAKSQYERAQAGLEQAKRALEEVNTFVSYTSIRAPFSGTITEKMVDQGSLIDPSRPLFVLETEAEPEVEFFVPRSLYSQVSAGSAFDVQVEGHTNTLAGEVIEISSSGAQSGGQFRARLAFTDLGEDILTGSYAKVLIPQSTNSDAAVLIPENALVRRGELTGVFAISGQNKAMLRWIRIGKIFNGQVEVLSGLSQGETILIDAPATVQDGTPIQGV